MNKKNIYLDEDLLFDSFFEMSSPPVEIAQDYFKHCPKTLGEMGEILELCYFIVRTAFMSEERMSHAERKNTYYLLRSCGL